MSDATLSDNVTDDDLLVRISDGDRAALSTLFRRRQADVYRVAMLMTGSVTAAEDVTQDVFLAVIDDASRFESGRASVRAWLCGIARNHARRRLDGEWRMQPLPESPEPAAAVVASDPFQDLANAEQVDRLRRGVLHLPLRYREVVVMCDLQELSYADAAAVLDCSIGTVRSRLHRGRALLMAKLRAHDATTTPLAKKISGCLA